MSTIANAKVAHNYNRYNGYFFGCLHTNIVDARKMGEVYCLWIYERTNVIYKAKPCYSHERQGSNF